ncbi:MAG: TIGR01777 family oxidoreductase [Candidatus Acidiferrales bacterium]
MRILMTGASGLVGTALATELRVAGATVSRFVRPGAPAAAGDVAWNPETAEMNLAAAEGADVVVNLAGASIGGGRWTARRKVLLRSSRVDLTERLVAGLGRLKKPPSILVSASAIGYYGDRGEEPLTEASASGKDFLATISRDWEAAAMKAEQFGMRTVIARFGIVLAKNGGALPQMLTPFKMGVGGRIGSGKQWMSWVALDDAVGAIRLAIGDGAVRGPLNVVAPNPVRNADFTRVLARVLRRPAIFPAPAFALRLMLGEMADALLLSSQRVVPQELSERGFRFQYADLESALRRALGT